MLISGVPPIAALRFFFDVKVRRVVTWVFNVEADFLVAFHNYRVTGRIPYDFAFATKKFFDGFYRVVDLRCRLSARRHCRTLDGKKGGNHRRVHFGEDVALGRADEVRRADEKVAGGHGAGARRSHGRTLEVAQVHAELMEQAGLPKLRRGRP